MTMDSQSRAFADAFIAPVARTWASHFSRELDREDDSSLSHRPSGSMIGAILTVFGTAQGYAVYFFSHETAQRVAAEFVSQPLIPGGDPALGAVNDVMKLIASNAALLMANESHSVDIKIAKIFVCQNSGMTGEESWTGNSYLSSKAGQGADSGPDEVSVFVDVGIPYQDPSEVTEKAAEIAHRAEEGPRPAAEASPDAEYEAPPASPISSADTLEKSDALIAKSLQARRFHVVDSKGRRRATLSVHDDCSTTLVLADEEGRLRAAMALSSGGDARIMFVDRYGRKVFAAPPASKHSRTPRNMAKRPAGRRPPNRTRAMSGRR